MIFQVYNKKINAWVKMKKKANGKTQILNVKGREPTKPFKGVMKH
ncbi:MAG: hypothetical protein PHS54_01260 [Clostridia bacterium]|nr:hypothetical protein [Clostridia bacterium]